MKIVKVTWVDACDFDTIAETKKECPQRVSVGYLVRQDDHCIALVSCKDVDGDQFAQLSTDSNEGVMIPLGMVLEIEPLKGEKT